MRKLVIALAAASSLTACVQYNEQCEAPIERAKDIVAYVKSGESIFIDRNNARHANNAFGQASADGFVFAFADSDTPAQLGIVNAGDIRSEGFCQARTTLKGQISNSQVHEVLLFDNLLYAVDVTEAELVDALEHSVAALTSTDPATGAPREITAPPARFLQLSSKFQMTVNCWKPARSASGNGQRVTALTIDGKTIDPRNPRTNVKYRVALAQFLLNGGDGYTMFVAPGQDPTRNPAQARKFGGTEANVAAAYMLQHYKSADNATGPELSVEPRIIFATDYPGGDMTKQKVQTCATPTPPAG